MIGLDSNVLVRYLTQDDPAQSKRATEIMEHRLRAGTPGYVSVAAMVETVWVLDRAYGFSDAEIATAIEAMLASDVLLIENEEEVFAAGVAVKEGLGSFADALVGALGAKADCPWTLTFDRNAARLATFRLA